MESSESLIGLMIGQSQAHAAVGLQGGGNRWTVSVLVD
jgi:hypothetical protein